MVKKDRGDAPIFKVKPGVFALREFDEVAVEEAETPAADSDAPEAVEAKPEEATPAEEPVVAEEETAAAAAELPGGDVFPEEDDDDDLILANLDDDSREGRKPRKRRPRRPRRDSDGDGASSPKSRSEGRSERRPAARSRTRREREPQAPAIRAAEAGEPVGRDLSDAIETALRGGSRQPKTLIQVAEALIETGRLAGTPQLLAPTLGAAIRGDNAKRRASGGRPRFREAGGVTSLLEWDLPADAVNAERDAVRAADRQRQSVRRAFIKRLRDLPDGALLELLATWLNAVGVHSLRAVRADAGDFSLAGTLRRGPEETPLAISIYRGKQQINIDAIVALRGGLHHFDQARIGWVITLGQLRDGTVAEAHAEGAAPCAVFDGDALAVSMEEVGVGIQRASLPLAALDLDLLDSLGGGATRSSTSRGGTSRGSSSSSTASSSGDSNGDEEDNKKPRRSRRRGRRRTGRDEGGDDRSQVESREASKASNDADKTSSDSESPETSDSKGSKAETKSESAPEPTEDKEKKAAEPAPAPEVEA